MLLGLAAGVIFSGPALGHVTTARAAGTGTGNAYEWGQGYLGDGASSSSSSPVQVAATGVTAVSAGGSHTLAIRNNGSIVAWGDNTYGQLGEGNSGGATNVPTSVVGFAGTPSGTAPPVSLPTAVAAGGEHSLALTAAGNVMSWGGNSQGQLGDGTVTASNTPVPVSGLSNGITAVAAGYSDSFALKSDDTVVAWGDNYSGDLGDGSGSVQTAPVAVAGLSNVRAIAAGWYHTLAVKWDGTVWSWGENYDGELGIGSGLYNEPTPVQVFGLHDIVAVSAGDEFSLALAADGTVYAWGYNGSGQLGDGSYNQHSIPEKVAGLGGQAVAVAAGGDQSFALLTTGTLTAWGGDYSGELGNGASGNDYTTPVAASMSGVAAVSAGNYFSAAISGPTPSIPPPPGSSHATKCGTSSDSAAIAWGGNSNGQVGDGTTTDAPTPEQVNGLGNDIVAVTAGDAHGVALRDDGSVVAWGDNSNYQLGDGRQETYSVIPVPVSDAGSGSCIVSVASGPYADHTLALKQDGTVIAWGSNSYGQLGDGGYDYPETPAVVNGLSQRVTAVAAGGDHSLALLANGNVVAWGDDSYGELGDNNSQDEYSPVAVIGLSNVTAISAGGYFSMALRSDGTVWTWGDNQYAELGDGNQTQSNVPVEVPGLSGVKAIAAGGYHALALKSDGTVVSWGYDNVGTLGNPSAAEYQTTPISVLGLKGTVKALSAGEEHNLALMQNGNVLAWGSNFRGALGDGTDVAGGPSPVQVATLYDNVAQISAGGDQSVVVGPPGQPTPPPTAAPSTPQITSVTPGDGAITVGWQQPPASDAVGTYTLTATQYGNPAASTSITVDGRTTQATVNGLISDCQTRYTVTLTAANILGTSPVATPSAQVVPNPHAPQVNGNPSILASGIPPTSDPSTAVIIVTGTGTSASGGTYDPLDGTILTPDLSYCGLYANKLKTAAPLQKMVNDFDGNDQLLPTPNITDTLAAAGAVILPFSYNGASLQGPPNGPEFVMRPYGALDTLTVPVSTLAAELGNEIVSIHNVWPDTKVVVIGHSLGGLIGTTLFAGLASVGSTFGPLEHIISLDGPTNGVEEPWQLGSFVDSLVAALPPLSGTLVDELGNLWGSRATWDQALLNADQQLPDGRYRYIAVGTAGDLFYDVPDEYVPLACNIVCSELPYPGLDSQLMYSPPPGPGQVEGPGPGDVLTPGTAPGIGYGGDIFAFHNYVKRQPSNISFLGSVVSGVQGDQTQLSPSNLPVQLSMPSVSQLSTLAAGGGARTAPTKHAALPHHISPVLSRERSGTTRTSLANPLSSGTQAAINVAAAAPGQSITISGSGLGSGTGMVYFGPDAAPVTGTVSAWSDTSITVSVPAGAATGIVEVVTASGQNVLAGGLTVLGVANGASQLAAQSVGTAVDTQPLTVTVAVTGSAGPLANVPASLSDGLTVLQTATTNSLGQATFTVSGYGTESLVAYSGSAFTTLSPTWQAPPSMSISVSASPAQAVSGQVVPVHALVTESVNGQSVPVPNQPVNFTVNGASTASLSATQGVTGADGVATTYVSDSSAGLDVVTAAADTNAATGQTTVSWAPSVTSVSPASGYGNGGTVVTISGSGFADGDTVDFGQTSASEMHVVNANTITATSPPGSGTVDVTVSAAGVSSNTSAADQFSYAPSPAVTSISPAVGGVSGGSTISINGSGFDNTSTVTVGGVAATNVVLTSATQISATVPSAAGPSTDDVVVTTTTGGPSTISPADEFIYAKVPTVANVVAKGGPTNGGTAITVYGTGLVPGATVSVGGQPANHVTVYAGDAALSAITPGQAPGTYDIIVTTPVGSSNATSADQFTYEASPSLTAITPAGGPLAGGTSVSISGANFYADSTVTFGSTPASSVTVNSSTSITAVSPATTSAGTVDVTVKDFGGATVQAPSDNYSYGSPQVTAVTPGDGGTGGGQWLTIYGSNFTPDATVSFGGTAAPSVTVYSGTELAVQTPAVATPSTVDVTVTTFQGTSATTAADHFTYGYLPTVTSVSPASGPYYGGEQLTITGTNFAPSSTVTIGGYQSPSVTVQSSTTIVATPAYPCNPYYGGCQSSYPVAVTNAFGASAPNANATFTINASPQISSLSPDAGPASGGTQVVISGSGFTADMTVTVGGKAATSVSVQSSSQIVATTPAGASGHAAVVKVADATHGSSFDGYSSYFGYGAPAVAALSQTTGPASGGNDVTITGDGFVPGSTVRFGGQLSPSVYSDNTTSILAQVPAGASGTVDVTVASPGGTSTTTASDQYTYVPPPTVTGLSPASGPEAGGNPVFISGTNFTQNAMVWVGGFGVTTTYISSTLLEITAPNWPAWAAQSYGPSPDVYVATLGGYSAASPAAQYTFVGSPVVTGVSPSGGPTGGGGTVIITGFNFLPQSVVTFGGVPATGVVVNSWNSITATAPPGVAGTVDVIVGTAGGLSSTTSFDRYTYGGSSTTHGFV